MEIIEWMNNFQINCSLNKFMEAITHPSLKIEDNSIRDYEQLETIGDAVLDLLILQFIHQEYPDSTPSQLTKGRSNIVNNKILGKVGKKLKIDKILRTSSSYQIVDKDLSNALEAIFGAIFVENGFEHCELFLHVIKDTIHTILDQESGGIDLNSEYTNPIGALQEKMQSMKLDLPVYTLINRQGPDNNPLFKMQASVNINDKIITSLGSGNSKKIAREMAARNLLIQINIKYP